MRQEKAKLLLDLARHLASSAEGMTLDEMAAAIGVGRRTIERMRDALFELFPQIDEISDPPTKRFRIAGGLDGFFQAPTVDELVELSKAASALKQQGAGIRAAALQSLERKIKSSMRAAMVRRAAPDLEALMRAETIAVQAGPQPFEDESLISLLREGIKGMRAVAFSYEGGSTPGRIREIVPYGITFGRSNYLVGAELGSTEPRSYRLSRIKNLVVLDTVASPPTDFDLRAYAGRSFGVYQGQMEDVVLRVRPEGVADALEWRFHPTQSITPQPDGSLLVRFAATGMLELAWHLFTWGDQIEVIEPHSLKETLRASLSEALKHHTSDTSGIVVPGD
jgi:predicted DNA-binding transcriptional regulator YafY